MDSFFTYIQSMLGWFGIILIILALAAVGFLARKKIPRIRFGSRDIVFFPVLGLVIWSLWKLGNQLGFFGNWVKETSRSIASNLESSWWTAILVITILVMVFDLFVPRKKKPGEEKEGFVARWDRWKPKFYFAVLWSVVILILNLIMSHLEIEAWRDLWTYKGTGSWFFSLIMILLVASMVLIVNVRMIEMRWCGAILLFLALWAWTWVAWTTGTTTERIVKENPSFIPLVVTETGIPNLVPKGAPIGFNLEDLISFDAVSFFVRIDGGKWKGPLPPGALQNTLEPGTKKLVLRCDTQDFYVTLRKPVEKTE